MLESRNLFFKNLTNTIGTVEAAASFISDPHFENLAQDDYHLVFPSPAIDHGIDAGINTNLDGNPRPANFGFDIGAYEYQATIYRWYFPIIYKN